MAKCVSRWANRAARRSRASVLAASPIDMPQTSAMECPSIVTAPPGGQSSGAAATNPLSSGSTSASPTVHGGSTLFTTLGFAGLYFVLGVLYLFLVAKEVAQGPRPLAETAGH